MGTIAKHNLGTISLSERVIVSDPAYRRGTWCMAETLHVVPGTYSTLVIKSDEGDLGDRVSSIILLCDGYEISEHANWDSLGYTIGVDSGQCGIFDDSIYPAVGVDHGSYADLTSFYGQCCNLTLSQEQGGILRGKAVVTSSGYGDGSYKVKALSKDNKCYALWVDFCLDRGRTIMQVLLQRD